MFYRSSDCILSRRLEKTYFSHLDGKYSHLDGRFSHLFEKFSDFVTRIGHVFISHRYHGFHRYFFRTRITRIARKRRGCEPFSLSLAATVSPSGAQQNARRGMMAVASHAVTRGLFVSLFRAPAYAALRAAG